MGYEGVCGVEELGRKRGLKEVEEESSEGGDGVSPVVHGRREKERETTVRCLFPVMAGDEAATGFGLCSPTRRGEKSCCKGEDEKRWWWLAACEAIFRRGGVRVGGKEEGGRGSRGEKKRGKVLIGRKRGREKEAARGFGGPADLAGSGRVLVWLKKME
ncbi:hypothetical protein HAX54_039835 [Datura stramonium]|uniref:Uncharacterized protein n=1 Tax=Datura stramonium TaxID=4076 RepID=A0ABS8VQ27_DATST|nr:hypothetical protein [Datura stramonium]